MRGSSNVRAAQPCAQINVGNHHIGTIYWAHRLIRVREFCNRVPPPSKSKLAAAVLYCIGKSLRQWRGIFL
jgi:hypothetical protein